MLPTFRAVFDKACQDQVAVVLAGCLYSTVFTNNPVVIQTFLTHFDAAVLKMQISVDTAPALLTTAIISGPAKLQFLVKNKKATLLHDLTDFLFGIAGLWKLVDMHKAALSANPDTKILIDEPVTYGRLPTQPEINDMPVVKSLYKLVNNIDDEEWGNKTVDIKKQMMNAIYDWQLLACEQSRCFQQTADPNTTDTDNDKELFKWLAMSDYTADFKACVEGNTVWKIIVCNWVALCRPRNSIWHFKGFAGVVHNQMYQITKQSPPNVLNGNGWIAYKDSLYKLAASVGMKNWPIPVDEDQ